MATLRYKGTKYSLPNIKLYRDGLWRPRFEPSPGLREAGWKGFNFEDATGQTLDLEAFMTAALDHCEQVSSWRKGAKPPQCTVKTHDNGRTLGRLFSDYQGHDWFKDLSPRTRTDYAAHMRQILDLLPPDAQLDALDAELIQLLYNRMLERHGPFSANYKLRILNRIFTLGIRTRLLVTNPIVGIDRAKTDPRLRILSPEEIRHLIATADAMNLQSVGTALALNEYVGQRPGDLLKLPVNLDALDNYTVPQDKRGARGCFPKSILDIVRPRLAQERDRITRQAQGATPTRLLIYENTGRPYRTTKQLAKAFAKVRQQAAKTMPSLIGCNPDGTPMTDIMRGEAIDVSHRERACLVDTRGTAITRLVLLGMDVYKVCSITGQDPNYAHNTWKHYVRVNPSFADAAGVVLAEWANAHGNTY